VTGPAKGPQQAQPGGPTPTDRTYVYQSFRQSGQPSAYVTEFSVPPSDSRIHRLHARMKEPEPEAGL